MKIKNLLIREIACALCILGTQEAEAQKVYKDATSNIIILDCGPDSGFPETMVEKKMGKKAISNPSDEQLSSDDNTLNGSINRTVYIKLEIAGSDETNENENKFTWAGAYQACLNKNINSQQGWRPPTIREQQLIWIFKTAIKALGAEIPGSHHWSATESNATTGLCTNMDYAYSGERLKTNRGGDCPVRCVREIPYTQEAARTKR